MEIRLMSADEVATFDDPDAEMFDDDDHEYPGDSQPVKMVTLKEILDAVRANGIPHVRDTWFDVGKYDSTTRTYEILGGCAVAQAARNLGVDPNYFRDALEVSQIVTLNDSGKRPTLDEIVDQISEQYPNADEIRYLTHAVDYSKGLPEYIFEGLS